MKDKTKNGLLIGLSFAVVLSLGAILGLSRWRSSGNATTTVVDSSAVRVIVQDRVYRQTKADRDLVIPVSIRANSFSSGSEMSYEILESNGDKVYACHLEKGGESYDSALPGPGDYDLHIEAVGYDREVTYTITVSVENAGKTSFDSKKIHANGPNSLEVYDGDFAEDGTIKLCNRTGGSSPADLRTIGELGLTLFVVSDEENRGRWIDMDIAPENEGTYVHVETDDFGSSSTHLRVISGTCVRFSFHEIDQGWLERFRVNLSFADDEGTFEYTVRQYGETGEDVFLNVPQTVTYDEDFGGASFDFIPQLGPSYDDGYGFTMISVAPDGGFGVTVAMAARQGNVTASTGLIPIVELRPAYSCMPVTLQLFEISPGATIPINITCGLVHATFNYTRAASE